MDFYFYIGYINDEGGVIMANKGLADKVNMEKVIHQAVGKTKEVVSEMKDVAEEVVEKVKGKM